MDIRTLEREFFAVERYAFLHVVDFEAVVYHIHDFLDVALDISLKHAGESVVRFLFVFVTEVDIFERGELVLLQTFERAQTKIVVVAYDGDARILVEALDRLYAELVLELLLPLGRHYLVGHDDKKRLELFAARELAYYHARLYGLTHTDLIGKYTALVQIEDEIIYSFFLIRKIALFARRGFTEPFELAVILLAQSQNKIVCRILINRHFNVVYIVHYVSPIVPIIVYTIAIGFFLPS